MLIEDNLNTDNNEIGPKKRRGIQISDKVYYLTLVMHWLKNRCNAYFSINSWAFKIYLRTKR